MWMINSTIIMIIMMGIVIVVIVIVVIVMVSCCCCFSYCIRNSGCFNVIVIVIEVDDDDAMIYFDCMDFYSFIMIVSIGFDYYYNSHFSSDILHSHHYHPYP